MFFSRLSLKETAEWAHTLSNCLNAGMSAVDSFAISGKRGRPRLRKLSNAIVRDLKDGEDISTALRNQGDIYPNLFVSLIDVAENTGHLPETLKQLEQYYSFQLRLRRQFISQIFWPVFQLIAAIFVIALVIYILGILSDAGKGAAMDLFGLGLRGERGAIVWLGSWFGVFAFLVVAYILMRRLTRNSALVDRVILAIPVIGPCFEALALSRICFALRTTLDTGMSILKAVPMSMAAADNQAFERISPRLVQRLRDGESLFDAIAQERLFPEEFLAVLSSAEASGTVPEAMGRLSNLYNEQAEHRLSILNTMAGWGVWLIVAVIIIFMVFRVFLNYIDLINKAAEGKL